MYWNKIILPKKLEPGYRCRFFWIRCKWTFKREFSKNLETCGHLIKSAQKEPWEGRTQGRRSYLRRRRPWSQDSLRSYRKLRTRLPRTSSVPPTWPPVPSGGPSGLHLRCCWCLRRRRRNACCPCLKCCCSGSRWTWNKGLERFSSN